MRIILLNGPPSSGKDTVAKIIAGELNSRGVAKLLHDPGSPDWKLLRMSHPIKRAFAGLVDADIDAWGNVGDSWEEQKDLPSTMLLGGKSYRQWQIEFSEKFMKPLYGNDIFVRLFVWTVEHLRDGELGKWNGYIIVPDCGFPIEASYIAASLPEVQTILVRVHRPGTNWAKDSRSYIYTTDIPRQYDLYNTGTIEELKQKAIDLIDRKYWTGFAG